MTLSSNKALRKRSKPSWVSLSNQPQGHAYQITFLPFSARTRSLEARYVEIRPRSEQRLIRLSSGHTTKLLITSQLYLAATLTLFTLFINNAALFSSFGFSDSMLAQTKADKRPIIIGFMLFQLVTSPLDPLASLGMNALSRKYEYEAGEQFLDT